METQHELKLIVNIFLLHLILLVIKLFKIYILFEGIICFLKLYFTSLYIFIVKCMSSYKKKNI